jgi:multidrug efflux pump subunit AcrA (membrane-fusion protein)
MHIEEDIDEDSYKVREVLGYAPGWFFRVGTFVIALCVVLLFFVAWLVKYPDIVRAQVVITTPSPPIDVYTRAAGRLKTIHVAEGEIVQEGQVLGYVENAAEFRDVMELKLKLRELVEDMDQRRIYKVVFSPMELGSIEREYGEFRKAYESYKTRVELDPGRLTIAAINNQIAGYEARIIELRDQERSFREELAFALENTRKTESLLAKGHASQLEFERVQQEYFTAQRQLHEHQRKITDTDLEIASLGRELVTAEIETAETDSRYFAELVASLDRLRSTIKAWDDQYVLRASLEGTVSFFNKWKENEFVSEGDHFVAIVPLYETAYVAEVTMPIENSGKVKIGQRALIKLRNYPYREFGMLESEVTKISLIPQQGRYAIEMRLPEGLVTNSRRTLTFRQNMEGEADIITEDTRLLERIFYPLKQIRI